MPRDFAMRRSFFFAKSHEHEYGNTVSLPEGTSSLRLHEDFVLHSPLPPLRRTWEEPASGAFTMMKLAGRSSVTVNQRYVLPTPESVERVFDRSETLNRKALERMNGKHPQNIPTAPLILRK